eukprot:m.36693 g.36693  ORF g.36693 m.36693 type:complete len:72 (-) comp10028_c0_seq2:2530-2745(-)
MTILIYHFAVSLYDMTANRLKQQDSHSSINQCSDSLLWHCSNSEQRMRARVCILQQDSDEAFEEVNLGYRR